MDTRTHPIRTRLEALREVMAREGVDALLVPSADPHLSEYLPERWQGRQFFSGFTGSMGTLVVMQDRAAVFADSRYWVQAEAELQGTGVDLVKIPTGTATHHVTWLTEQVRRGGHPAAHRYRPAAGRLARAPCPADRSGLCPRGATRPPAPQRED